MGKIALGLTLVFAVASSAFAAEPRARTEMDAAVDRALEFLQRTQESDGGWRAGRSKSAAITGLCVMAFLSAGHVPREGPYGETVEKGVRWVLQAQRANGVIAVGSGFEMYHHGICALMLAEVAGMTDDKLGAEVRRSLERAVEVILKAQRSSGAHRGTMSGLSARSARNPQTPRVVPSTEASAASARLSVSSCRVIRPAVAPNAIRMPISRRRKIDRASIALATLAQAISSTSITPAPSALPIVR